MANLPALTPTTFAEALQFAELLAKSTMVPPAFQRNPANIVLAVQWGAELGMPPLQALQSIAVINGKPAVYGDAMLALVRGSPLCEDIIEHVEGEGENRVAVCEARRKGKAPVFGRFSIINAKQAKLWGKAGPWTEYPGRMLQMRARAFALRDAFPDILRGIIAAEEAADTPRQAKDITPPAQNVEAELDAFGLAPIAEKEPASDWHRDKGSSYPPAPAESGTSASDIPSDDETGDAPSAEAAEAPELGLGMEPVKVPRKGRGWDWPEYANELIAIGTNLPREQLGDFRRANASMINSLRMSDKEQWARVQQTLANYERGDDPNPKEHEL